MTTWNDFKPNTSADQQPLPPANKYVLVRLMHPSILIPDPVVVGYLKYHAGVKSEPYFVTPGCSIYTAEENALLGDGKVVQWCDCLPDDFEFPV